MAKCASLAWLLLLSIFIHAQSVRSSKNQPFLAEECEAEPTLCEDEPTLNDHVVAAGVVGEGDGDHVLKLPPSSLMMSHQGVIGYDIAYTVGGMLVGIVLALAVGCLCHAGPSTSATDERDDDSDDSVVTMGEGLDPGVWWNKSRLSSIITTTSERPEVSLIAPPWNSTALDNIFQRCGLEKSWKEARTSKLAEELKEDLSQECGLVRSWRQGKTSKLAEDLIEELSLGKSSFFTQNGQTGLKCVIYVMQVALHYVPDNLVLQEFTHSSDKAVFVTDDYRLPKTKMRTCERIDECLFRCLTVKLGIGQGIAEKFASRAVLHRAEEEATDGSAAAIIPNMTTIVRKLTLHVPVEDVDDNRKYLGIDEGSLNVDARGMQFRWERVGEDYFLRKLLKKAPDARKVKPWWKPSGLAVLPWSLSEVNEHLTSRGIAPASFGDELQHLVQMLRDGEVQLGVEESTGKLVCVEHRVYLKLCRRNGDFFVHRGNDHTPACLPNVQLLANETPFVAALRAARSKLGSVSVRVELKPRVRDVQSTFILEPPNMFANGQPMKYVVRELMVEGLACA